MPLRRTRLQGSGVPRCVGRKCTLRCRTHSVRRVPSPYRHEASSQTGRYAPVHAFSGECDPTRFVRPKTHDSNRGSPRAGLARCIVSEGAGSGNHTWQAETGSRENVCPNAGLRATRCGGRCQRRRLRQERQPVQGTASPAPWEAGSGVSLGVAGVLVFFGHESGVACRRRSAPRQGQKQEGVASRAVAAFGTGRRARARLPLLPTPAQTLQSLSHPPLTAAHGAPAARTPKTLGLPAAQRRIISRLRKAA